MDIYCDHSIHQFICLRQVHCYTFQILLVLILPYNLYYQDYCLIVIIQAVNVDFYKPPPPSITKSGGWGYIYIGITVFVCLVVVCFFSRRIFSELFNLL